MGICVHLEVFDGDGCFWCSRCEEVGGCDETGDDEADGGEEAEDILTAHDGRMHGRGVCFNALDFFLA